MHVNIQHRNFILRWLSNARFARFARRRFEISKSHLLLMKNRIFQMAILEIRRVIIEYEQVVLLPNYFRIYIQYLTLTFKILFKKKTKTSFI